MPAASVAEALLRAHLDRATGWVTCSTGGRTSRLGFRDGDLVKAELQFGFQTPLQGLMQTGQLTSEQLDALWARGEAGKADDETLEELGVTPGDAHAASLLASVRRVTELAEAVRFESAPVDGDGAVPGARVARSAFEVTFAPDGEPPFFRLIDRDAALAFAQSDGERALLEGFGDFASAAALEPAQYALLEVLVRSGVAESIPAEEHRRREADRAEAEERARREEQERLEAEERARQEEAERLRREEEGRLRLEEAERQRREEEERQRREEEERLRLEEEERQRREEEERARLEEEERQRREAEEQARREEEERQRREEEERERVRAAAATARRDEETRLLDARRRVDEEEARIEQERQRIRDLTIAEEQRRVEEARARREAEEQARREEAELLQREAEEQARREEEERLRQEEEERARREAEEQARREEEERQRQEEEERARREEEERQRQEEEERARREEEERQRREEEERLQREAEEQARRVEEERLRLEEEERQRLEEEERQRAEEERQRREEEERQREEQERARREEEERQQREAEEQAGREEAARLRREEEARLEREAEERARREEDDRRRLEEAEAARREEQERIARLHAEAAAELKAAEAKRRVEATPLLADDDVQLEDDLRRAAAFKAAQDAKRRDAEEARRREEEAQIEEDLRRAAEVRQAMQSGLRPFPNPAPSPVPMQQALGNKKADSDLAAKHSAQQDLLQRLNAALRQSVGGAPGASSPSAPPLPPPTGAPRRDDKTDPAYLVPPEFQDAQPSPSVPNRPLVLSGQPSDDVDLWRIAEPAAAGTAPPGAAPSFEEALRRVDSSLESLVGQLGESARQEGIAEPIIEAELESSSQDAAFDDVAGGEDELGDPSDPAEAARLRRQRLLRRAMENIGSMPARPPSQQPALVEEPAAPSSSPSSAARAAGAPAPTPAEQQLAAQIEARHAGLKQQKDLFSVLGLARGASKEDVKGAFLNLAKVFHPDRLPPSLPHLASKMSAVFEAIRSAYDMLHDDAKRAVYLSSSTAEQPKTPEKQSEELVKAAEVFFKKRDYRHAEEQYAKAATLAPHNATILAAQAWCIYMDPTRKAEGEVARAMMQKALGLNANCDRAHYQLGVIARVEGDMDRAEKHFREAVRANPKHLEANQEIRLIEIRRKKAQDGGKKGFFK